MTIVLDGGCDLAAFRSSVMVLLLTHAVLGCCSHHAHGCGGPNTFDGLNGLPICRAKLHADSTGQACQGQGEVCGQGGCVEDRCVAVRNTDDERASAPNLGCQSSVLIMQIRSDVSFNGLSRLHMFIASLHLLPVRLHLADQVILI